MVRLTEPIPPPPEPPAFEPPLYTPDIPAQPAADMRYALVFPGGRFPLGESVVVLGRARECEIHVSDPNVSRRHAEIRPDGPFYLIVDLGSTNGTELNGQRIKSSRLTEGDVIAIGQTELTFVRE
jgi:pSer/pThr/pTyr-binding forkhead associated (FHA) protein